jgi:FixJ family two-component response regulator
MRSQRLLKKQDGLRQKGMRRRVPTVYIVDDDASVRRALGRLIRTAGYQVEVFGAATEYLAREPPERPACLVLDIRMPGMTGIELQRAIEGTPRCLPIVFITGHGDDAIRDQSLAAGAVDVLYKPVDDHVLLAAIEQALWRSVRH